MSRRTLLSLVAGALLLAAVGWLSREVIAGSDVPVYEVERGRFLHRIEAEGVLAAEQATDLNAPGTEPMKLAWILEDGTRVGAGEVVVRFDPTDMENELFNGEIEQSKADQQINQRQLEQVTALQNLDRDRQLAELQLEHAAEFQSTDEEIFSQKEIAESEIDRTLASHRKQHTELVREIREDLGSVELELLELQRRQAQLQIERARDALEALEVRAPHDGIFVLSRDRRGEIPTIGQIVYPGQTLAQIPQLDAMKATVYVLEADAGGLEPGIPAEVRIEAHPGAPVPATVRRIANVAQRRDRWSPVQYFEVELALEGTDTSRMKPGQRVRTTLRVADLDEVIAVPREAIFRDVEGNPIVHVRQGGGFVTRAVTLGPAALGRVVIEAGLETGEVVALEDPSRRSEQPQAEPTPGAPGFPTRTP